MNEKVKEILDNWALELGYDIDEESDYIELLEEGEQVKHKKCGSHRWYDDVEIISKFGNRYIKWYSYYTTGDISFSDMDLYINLNLAREVFPYEVTITKIKYKE